MRFVKPQTFQQLWNIHLLQSKDTFDFASTIYVVVSKDLLQQDVVEKRVFWR